MENEKNNTLTQNDILEGIRTLNAIYSAMMIGSQVAIEKFIAKKKIPRNARKFFISEMARSLDQIPDVRQELEQAQKFRQLGGAWSLPKIPIKNPFNRNKKGSVSVPTLPGELQPQSQPLPLDATQPLPVVSSLSANDSVKGGPESSESSISPDATATDTQVCTQNKENDMSAETQQEMEKEYIDALISSKMMLGKGIFKKIIQVSSNIVERIIDYTTGGILNKPPAELAGETNKIILVLSMVLKDLSTDEKQIQAMKDISEALTKSFLDVMDIIAPTIKEIVSKTFDNISSIGMQGASGSMRIFISMSKAAISEIPIAGGIINLILAFGESFNVFSKIVSTFMSRSSHMSNDVVNAFMQARAKFEESFARHKREIQNARNSINTLTNPTQSIVNTVAEVVPGLPQSSPLQSSVSNVVPSLNASATDQSENPFVPVSIPRGKGLFDNRTREEKAIDLVNQKATTELNNAEKKGQLANQSNAQLESRRQMLEAQKQSTKQRQEAYNARIEANNPNILSRSFSKVGQRFQNFKDQRAQTQLEKNISKLEKQYEVDKKNADIAQEKANKARERASSLNLSFSQKQEAEQAKKEAEEQLTESNRKLKEAEDNLKKEVGPTRFEKFKGNFKGLFTRTKPKQVQTGGKYKYKYKYNHKTKKRIKRTGGNYRYIKTKSKLKVERKIKRKGNKSKRKMKQKKYLNKTKRSRK